MLASAQVSYGSRSRYAELVESSAVSVKYRQSQVPDPLLLAFSSGTEERS